ncbi:transposable element Tc1 transposase [Trichonephila clavipes]|nr:transposable element Tc1 transposase [Trichonephila clavipes]
MRLRCTSCGKDGWNKDMVSLIDADTVRVTLVRVDRCIHRQVMETLQAFFAVLLQHVQNTLDASVSSRLITCRLVLSGLLSWHPLRRLPSTPQHRRLHFQWCWARATWPTEWHGIFFSD